MSEYTDALDEERALIAPLVDPESILPVEQVEIPASPELAAAALSKAKFSPQVPVGAAVQAFKPQDYGAGADAKALAQAEADRAQTDQASKLLDAATSFNKAFGGNLGDLAAPTRATRDDSFKDVMRRRAQSDQDLQRQKLIHDTALADALERGDSPESVKVKEMFSGTTVGSRLRQNMGEDAWTRLPGKAIPGAKEQLASETSLLRNSDKKEDPSMRAGFAAFLKAKNPKMYEQLKDIIPTLSADAIKNLGSNLLRQESLDQPSMRVSFSPEGYGITYDRKHPEKVMTPPAGVESAPARGEAPALDTSVDVREPDGVPAPVPGAEIKRPEFPVRGPNETPKDFMKRKDAIRSLGSPSEDWKWDPRIYTGEIAPPSKHEVDKVKDLTKDVTTALDYKTHIDDFLKQHPNGFPAGVAATKAAEWSTGLQTLVRSAMNMGVYRSFDQPILDKVIADPTSLGTILKSAVGVRDLRTQMQTLGDEISQRAWTENQTIHQVPSDTGRWAGFKPRVGKAGPGGPSDKRVPVKTEHSQSRNQTRYTYADGTTETVEGLR